MSPTHDVGAVSAPEKFAAGGDIPEAQRNQYHGPQICEKTQADGHNAPYCC